MYLTPNEAMTRLSARYDINVGILIGDVMVASEELDGMAPFKDDVDFDALPDALLDWIALRAYESAQSLTEPPQATRIKAADVTVDLALESQTRRRMSSLITPYLRYTGRVA